MVNTVYTVAMNGLEGFNVSVECNVEKGLPEVSVIGLPDATVKEAIDRIRSALANNSLPFIKGKTTFNLAPADKKKVGSFYDLAITISLLKHSVLDNIFTDDAVFIGELSLKGELREVTGALPMCIAARNAGKKRIFLPHSNASEASVIKDVEIYGVNNIGELIAHLREQETLTPIGFNEGLIKSRTRPLVDFSEIKGQVKAKRSLEIAAAGGHNVLLAGPPGSGKSMLAKAMIGILPDMTYDEIIEATKVHSVAGRLSSENPVVNIRPFRSPHHTVSHVGVVGGGTIPQPGEVSLAHNGVLFLDELTEFNKKTLEALRQPIEDKTITVARASYKLTYPCDFLLVCAMNPCPCGYYGSEYKDCTCSRHSVKKYLDKLSGPLLDRIDIQIEVPAMKFDDINSSETGETSEQIRQRVNAAREFSRNRCIRMGIEEGRAVKKENCSFTKEAEDTLEYSFGKLLLSARGYDRIVRISRTIANMAFSDNVERDHVLEAVQHRSLEQKYFSKF